MKNFHSVNILLMVLILPFQQHVLANPLPLDTESTECASHNGFCNPAESSLSTPSHAEVTRIFDVTTNLVNCVDRLGTFIGVLSQKAGGFEIKRDSEGVDDLGDGGNGGTFEMGLGEAHAKSSDVDVVTISHENNATVRPSDLLAGGDGTRKKIEDKPQVNQGPKLTDGTKTQIPGSDAETVQTTDELSVAKHACQNNTPGSNSCGRRVSTGEFPRPMAGIPPCDCERMPAACCYCC